MVAVAVVVVAVVVVVQGVHTSKTLDPGYAGVHFGR